MNRNDQVRPEEPPDEGPGLVRRLVRWISALVLLGLMAGSGHQMLRWEPDYLPIRVVSLDGELRRLSPQLLRETVIEHLRGGIVTQDLEELKEAVEALPWVSTASMRRMWPDRIELTVREHVPLARWGEDGLVSLRGVVFRPPASEIPGGLPLLTAADAHAPELAKRLQAWRPLLSGLGLNVEHLSLDARGAWAMRTDAGFDLALGRLQVTERMSRFLSAWPSLTLVGKPAIVDMRYSNGLAVTWDAGRQEIPGPKTHARSRIKFRTGIDPEVAKAESPGAEASALDDRSSSRPSAHRPRPSSLTQAYGFGPHRS